MTLGRSRWSPVPPCLTWTYSNLPLRVGRQPWVSSLNLSILIHTPVCGGWWKSKEIRIPRGTQQHLVTDLSLASLLEHSERFPALKRMVMTQLSYRWPSRTRPALLMHPFISCAQAEGSGTLQAGNQHQLEGRTASKRGLASRCRPFKTHNQPRPMRGTEARGSKVTCLVTQSWACLLHYQGLN